MALITGIYCILLLWLQLEGEALDAFEEQQLEKRKKIIELNAMEHRTKKTAEKDEDTEDPSTRLSLSDVKEGEQEIGIPPDTPISITGLSLEATVKPSSIRITFQFFIFSREF